jgi:hypothetical protein
MAGLIGEVALPYTSISSGTTYQLWQCVAPAHQKVLINGWFVGNDANTNSTPGLLSLYFAGTAGSGGTSATPVSIDQDDTETFQSTWITMVGTLASSLTLIRSEFINPQVSVPQYLPLFEEIRLKGGGCFVVQFIPQYSGKVGGWIRFSE